MLFSAVNTKLKGEIEQLKSVTLWQDTLREVLNPAPGGASTINLDEAAVNVLRAAAPSKAEWQMFDHYAAVTRIYALFEIAVQELIEEYATLLVRITPKYSDLDEAIRNQHRVGIGLILGKWGAEKSLYSYLKEDGIASGLADGLRGQPYTLLADAFLTDSDNYRSDTIVRLFKKIGLDDVFSAIKNNPKLKDFCDTKFSGDTAESALNELVRIRNISSHGEVTEFLSVKQIINYADFVVLITESLATVLAGQAMKKGISTGFSKHLGIIARKFSNNVVGVRAITDGVLKLGDVLWIGKKSFNIYSIESLQVVNDSKTEINISAGFEFGMSLNGVVAEGAEIYRWSEPATG